MIADGEMRSFRHVQSHHALYPLHHEDYGVGVGFEVAAVADAFGSMTGKGYTSLSPCEAGTTPMT
jgi:hypothetical protein